MIKPWAVLGLLAAGWLGATSNCSAQVVGGIVSQEEAERHGLTRAWYMQADLDRAAGKIVDVTLNGGTLFVQTDRARLQAIDAETGETRWSVTVGNERYPCTVPGASADFVATINGSTLYVIDRKTGRESWNKQLPNVTATGPAVSATHVFVPMVNGSIFGYDLLKPDAIPFRYKSFGRILVQPVATPDTLSWTTEDGYLYLMSLADPEHLAVNFRLETNDRIESRPGYWTPLLYGVSLDGYVYAVHEETGRIEWKYSTAEPIVEAPIAVNGRVYVCAERGGMFCLDGVTGAEQWYAPNVTQFISASPTRVYGSDRLNRLLILDGKSGARLDMIPLPGVTRKLHNTKSDRIYITTAQGVVQCLHEAELTEPVLYTPPPLKVEEKPKTVQKGLPADEEAPAAETDEEMPAEEPAVEEDNPFGEPAEAADEQPREEAMEEDDNPFG